MGRVQKTARGGQPVGLPNRRGTLSLLRESGRVVRLFTSAASTPWRPTHAGAGMAFLTAARVLTVARFVTYIVCVCVCVCVPSRLKEHAGWYFRVYVRVRLLRRASRGEGGWLPIHCTDSRQAQSEQKHTHTHTQAHTHTGQAQAQDTGSATVPHTQQHQALFVGGGAGLLALRLTHLNKILTQNPAKGKSILIERPFVGLPQSPPLM